jgi:hypothetical protein
MTQGEIANLRSILQQASYLYKAISTHQQATTGEWLLSTAVCSNAFTTRLNIEVLPLSKGGRYHIRSVRRMLAGSWSDKEPTRMSTSLRSPATLKGDRNNMLVQTRLPLSNGIGSVNCETVSPRWTFGLGTTLIYLKSNFTYLTGLNVLLFTQTLLLGN